MANLLSPTYQDYLNYQKSLYGNASEGGSGNLSEEQWNALGPAGQWQSLGSGMALANNDPRYAALASQLGVKDGGRLNVAYAPQSLAVNGQNYVDPSKVQTGGDVYATAHSNETPKTQFAGGGMSDKQWALAALSLLGGGAALGTALGGGAAAGSGAAGVSGSSALTTGGFGTDISAGSGAFGGAGAGVGASAAPSGGGFDSAGNWQDIPTMNNVPSGTLDALGPDATPLATAPSGAGSSSGGLLGNLGQSSSDLLSQAGNWAMNNPLRAAGLLQTAYGLFNKPGTPGGNGGGGSGSSGTKGGSGTASSFQMPQTNYTVNPYIAAQIRRGYGQ